MKELTGAQYVETEYGIEGRELTAVARRLRAKAKRAIKAGKARSFEGDIEKSICG